MDDFTPQDHEEELLFAAQDLVGIMEYRKRKAKDKLMEIESFRIMQEFPRVDKPPAPTNWNDVKIKNNLQRVIEAILNKYRK